MGKCVYNFNKLPLDITLLTQVGLEKAKLLPALRYVIGSENKWCVTTKEGGVDQNIEKKILKHQNKKSPVISSDTIKNCSTYDFHLVYLLSPHA